jgi:hypothetical protein
MLTNLLNKPEAYRKKIALVSTVFIFMLIVGVWANVRGFGSDSAKLAVAPQIEEKKGDTAPTRALSRSFSESFNAFKESLASVFVPFITGIEVYESGE